MSPYSLIVISKLIRLLMKIYIVLSSGQTKTDCCGNVMFSINVSLQPRSQGLRGETVTKTLVKFVSSFQNFGEKIACAVRPNRIAITVEYGCVSLRMRFFSQNFGTIKRILPGSSSPSHREGPGTEVVFPCWSTSENIVPEIRFASQGGRTRLAKKL